jgi:hypothetical protein
MTLFATADGKCIDEHRDQLYEQSTASHLRTTDRKLSFNCLAY